VILITLYHTPITTRCCEWSYYYSFIRCNLLLLLVIRAIFPSTLRGECRIARSEPVEKDYVSVPHQQAPRPKLVPVVVLPVLQLTLKRIWHIAHCAIKVVPYLRRLSLGPPLLPPRLHKRHPTIPPPVAGSYWVVN
jgi:hypothetical protein